MAIIEPTNYEEVMTYKERQFAMQEEIFIEQPQGFGVDGKVDIVYKLKKALYGLKQLVQQFK